MLIFIFYNSHYIYAEIALTKAEKCSIISYMKELDFKELEPEKLNEVLDFIRGVFLEFNAPDYSEEGRQRFMSFIDPKRLHLLINELMGENPFIFRMWTCSDNNKIVGALMGNVDHLYLLFVDGKYHRRGIARRLFNMQLEHYERFTSSKITVNSSLYAVEVYQKLGFAINGEEVYENGLRFIPMEYIRE
jgi:GNAT superfamily N-acetyltransferase